MADDFERKRVILDKVEDPHQKDMVNIGLTAADCWKQMNVTLIAGLCYGACAALMEAGDHTMGGIFYVGCSAWLGITSYRSFRKIWQSYSIPVKNYILSFFKTC